MVCVPPFIPAEGRRDRWLGISGLLLCLGVSLACTHRNVKQQSAIEIGITLRGCLELVGEDYVVIQNRTHSRFLLTGVGNKIARLVGHEVEVTGAMTQTYSIQVENVRTDVVSISDKCD